MQTNFDSTGYYVTIAGMIVAALSNYGIIIPTDTVVTILAGAMALYGLVMSFIAHKEVAKAATAAGVRLG